MIKEELHKQPNICYYHGVFDGNECDFIIEESERTGRYERSMIYNTETQLSESTEMRTSTSFVDKENKFDKIKVKAYEIIKEKLPNISIKHIEQAQIQKYENTQYVKNHVDYFNINGKKITDSDKIATLIVYLNDDFGGGETLFNHFNIKINPIKGSALFFQYNYNDYLNEKSRHEGLPVIEGTKYIITFWVREQPLW
jgi:prolyl 4-hydroxylase